MKFENTITSEPIKMNEKNSEIKLSEVFEEYKRNWRWVFLSLVLALLFAYLFLRYSQNQFEVSTTIFINDKKSGGLSSELSAFQDLGVLGSMSDNSVNNETGILLSRSLSQKIVKKLGINVTYFNVGKVKMNEIYGKDKPLRIIFFIKDSILYNIDTTFTIKHQSKNSFQLISQDDEKGNVFEYGNNITTSFGEINITKVSDKLEMEQPLMVKILPLKKVAKYYNQAFQVQSEPLKTSLVTISLVDNVRGKAIDILNSMVNEYNNNAIDYKNLIAENTDKFINERIIDIALDLENVDKNVEEFKRDNRLTDLNYEAGLVLDSNSELQKSINDISAQLKLIDYIIIYLNENKKSLIPANLGIKDQATSENTAIYNKLILERNRIIKGSSQLNPTVVNLEAQIATLRKSIEQSLNNFKASLSISLSEARKQEYLLIQKRELAPRQEREYQDIRRKQQIIETLYLYLLQKREENAISLGIPIPNAKIIDEADGSDIPVFPNAKIIYLLSGVFGFIFPYLMISLFSVLNNKVRNSENVELRIGAPMIGEIPRAKPAKKIILSTQTNSVFAEAMRLVRTNINFILSISKGASKSIFITSTVSGEGKTFIAINLAASLSLLDKKVLLIGGDIRKPNIASYLKIKPKLGLTHYLADPNIEIEKIIENNNKFKFDFLDSGEIPPNPSELLLNGRFEKVIEYGKNNYDFVVVDTSPIGSVTDSLLLGIFADLYIYVVRIGFLDRNLLKIPRRLYEKNRLPNMAVLTNDVKIDKKQYGYAYGKESKSWFKRLFQ